MRSALAGIAMIDNIVSLLKLGFLVCALLFTDSCKKDETPHYTIPASLLAYADFQENSYWIYYDNKNHQSDSTYILNKIFETITSSDGPVNPNQFDRLTVQFSGNVYSIIRTIAYNGGGMTEVKYADATYGIFDTWMIEDPGKYQNNDVEFYPSYTLNDKTYEDVYRSITKEIIGSSTVVTDNFFAKNYGIIRVITKTNNDTTFSWSLVRAKIIQ